MRSQFTARVMAVPAIGIIAVSFASILIRWCPAPALSIAFYRLLFASLFFGLFTGRQAVREWRNMPSTAFSLGLISGIGLAAHFATWITSLFHTTVASSVVLVSTSPIFVALGTRFILREPMRPLLFVGLGIAIGGAAIIALADAGGGHGSIRGDALALAGALAVAVYLLAGRILRRQLGTSAYVLLSYSTAALALFFGALGLRAPLAGFSSKIFGMFILIALVPQVIGHTSFNWALKHFSAPTVSVMFLGEPVGASILAYLLLGERIGGLTVVGGIVTLLGVAMVLLSEFGGEKKCESKNRRLEMDDG
ncbi:MAG: DMT family transporter [candidate division KSB1 bacterium]|nr:DMT family transporter [candidate division KSB1 bacterium]MDZ7310433.1 DMT family transporter [candidate division KSB1 bacterium]